MSWPIWHDEILSGFSIAEPPLGRAEPDQAFAHMGAAVLRPYKISELPAWAARMATREEFRGRFLRKDVACLRQAGRVEEESTPNPTECGNLDAS